MTAFATFRQHTGMAYTPQSYEDLVVNVDLVLVVSPSRADQGHSVLTVQGEQYTFEVAGDLRETLAVLRRAVEDQDRTLRSIDASLSVMAEDIHA